VLLPAPGSRLPGGRSRSSLGYSLMPAYICLVHLPIFVPFLLHQKALLLLDGVISLLLFFSLNLVPCFFSLRDIGPLLPAVANASTCGQGHQIQRSFNDVSDFSSRIRAKGRSLLYGSSVPSSALATCPPPLLFAGAVVGTTALLLPPPQQCKQPFDFLLSALVVEMAFLRPPSA